MTGRSLLFFFIPFYKMIWLNCKDRPRPFKDRIEVQNEIVPRRKFVARLAMKWKTH
jgi:hypothetical protein